MNNRRGQISILGAIGIGVSIAVAAIGGFFSNTIRNEDRAIGTASAISALQAEVSAVKSSVEKLEKDGEQTRKDVSEIKTLLIQMRAR